MMDEIAGLLKEYRCYKLTGDNYAAGWVAEAFAKAGVWYEKSTRERSAVYMDTLPLFASGRVRLIDSPRMVSQFCALERRTFSTGRERVDPGPGHDDLCNSAAIALSLAASKAREFIISDAILAEASRPGRRWNRFGEVNVPVFFR
jgi:hypothetical protein